MADGLLRADLKENLGLGANAALVSWNFSWSALIAYSDEIQFQGQASSNLLLSRLFGRRVGDMSKRPLLLLIVW
jgi:hypothetical protein